jgi:hypothetical protein
MKAHYPDWSISKSLSEIFKEIHDSWAMRSEMPQ